MSNKHTHFTNPVYEHRLYQQRHPGSPKQITSSFPLVARLEKILMLLPRRHIHVDLQVEEDIRVLDLAKGEYQSTGMDPRFEMRFSDDPIEAGWYYLEAALVRHSGNRTSKIYFDTGRGFNEADSIFIPSNLRGSIREVFYLPEGIQRLPLGSR